jgi:PTS system sucrose-specific IIC component
MHPSLGDIVLFGTKLVPGRGGIIAVLLVVFFASKVEKAVRKVMPESLDLILTPLITVLVAGAAAVLVLQPLGGWISESIGRTVTGAISGGGAFIGAALAGTFLPLVMTGIHQGLTPIHADLIASKGFTILLPILAMAGAGQVGASIAVYFKTKNKRLKRTIASALPVGILGVGEPLIYGVTLPLGKPFLGACIGGAAGGAVVAAFGNIGAVAMGLSGLPLAAAIVPGGAMKYLIGVISAYVVGFIATSLIGFNDPVEE